MLPKLRKQRHRLSNTKNPPKILPKNSLTEKNPSMAALKPIRTILISLFVVISYVQFSHCKKQGGVARKEDVPYIKCQVCEKLANQLYNQVKNKQDQINPKKISEYEIIEISENVCNLKKQEADWILKIDIVEKGDKLELVEHDSEGQCDSECKTIERACQEVIGYSDTDVAEFLYKKKPQIDALFKYLCKDLSGACIVKPPPVPKDRTPGEPFIPKSSKEVEMERLMKSMEGMPGAPGMKMYSREDLMNNMNNLGDEDGDEDDDDDETSFHSNLKKVLKEKQTEKADWKQKITKRIAETGEALKKHATKVAFRLQKWWKGKKTSTSTKSSKSKKAEL